MKQLISFWKDLVVNGEKHISDIPDKIKLNVITLLVKDGAITNNDLCEIKAAKIEEMSAICNGIIVEGFDIELSDGETHHFSLEVADQLKISKLNDRANNGSDVLPYHADGEICKFYSAQDIAAINEAMENRIEYHVTYFNSLRNYINDMNDISQVMSVSYGVQIPEKYQSDVLKLLLSQMK